jgi:membrane protein YdbS with pleckstrin-like domain
VALSKDLLIDGESVVLSARTHLKSQFGSIAWGVLIVAAVGAAYVLLGTVANGWLAIGVAGLGAVLLLVMTVAPLVRWSFSTYTLTTMRLVEQRGVFNRSGRIIPLSRVNDVSFEKSLADRLFGCGTLSIHDASEQSGLDLVDIPHVERFHRTISALVLQAHGQAVVADPDLSGEIDR